MELRDIVVGIVSKTLGVLPTDIHDDSKLADLAKDSIALFELLIAFESTLERHVNYEEIAHVETVGDIVTYIEKLPTISKKKS